MVYYKGVILYHGKHYLFVFFGKSYLFARFTFDVAGYYDIATNTALHDLSKTVISVRFLSVFVNLGFPFMEF